MLTVTLRGSRTQFSKWVLRIPFIGRREGNSGGIPPELLEPYQRVVAIARDGGGRIHARRSFLMGTERDSLKAFMDEYSDLKVVLKAC